MRLMQVQDKSGRRVVASERQASWIVNRYRTGSTLGRLHAIEVWNEPNLHKEWGNQPVNRHQAAEARCRNALEI